MTTTIDTVTAPARPARVRRVTASANAPPSIAKPTSKSDNVLKLLLRTKGATPVELIAATGWQPHSMRAFLSGLRKKGRTIVREERKGGGYAYRIVGTPGAEPRAMTTSASALDRTSGIYPDGRSSPRTQNGAAPAADA